MGVGSEVRRRATAWCFIALLLGERAAAIRSAHLEEELFSEKARMSGASLQAALRDFKSPEARMGPKETKAVEKLSDNYQRGKALEVDTTCEQLQGHMLTATDQVMEALHAACTADLCDFDFSTFDVDRVIAGQEVVTALAATADRKECLPAVMGSTQMDERLRELLSIVPKVLSTSATQEGRDRTRDAYTQLLSFQGGVLGLEDDLTDRQLLLDFDIPQKDCPAPCQQCDHYDSTAFGFRCLLRRADKDRAPELPGRHGVTCSTPRYRWFRRYPFGRQCHVADWRESALQHVHVAAMLSCATTTLLMGLESELTQAARVEMHRLCLKAEQGSSLTVAEEEQYRLQLERTDEVVSKGVKLAFVVILTFGLASGLAGLRAASRGNERPPVLLEAGKGMQPEDYTAAYLTPMANLGITMNQDDGAMYGDRQLMNRDETLQKLDTCQDVYNLKSANTFAEGARPLSVMAMAYRPNEGVLAQELFGGAYFFYIVVYVFVSLWIAASAGVLWASYAFSLFAGTQGWVNTVIAARVVAVMSAMSGVIAVGTFFLLTMSLFGAIFGGGASERLDTCLKGANSTHAVANF